MKGAYFAGIVLLLATPASAVPIIPPQHLCGCALVELAPEPHVNAPDPGYDPTLGAEQIALLKAQDDAHEPLPEPALWTWVCLPGMPNVPGQPGRPGKPDQHMGGGGSPGGGGHPGGEIEPRSVPEPGSWALVGTGLLAAARRKRRRG